MKFSISIKCLSLLFIASLFFSCNKSSPNYNSPNNNNNNPPPVPGSISIANMSFSPGTTTVKAGTTVTWKNNDNMNHTVTADDGSFDSGAMSTGQTFSYTFNTAGTIKYHCTYHSNMTANVVVN